MNVSEFIDNSMLDLIYSKREDSLYQFSKNDEEKIKEISKNNPITYDDLLVAIKNLPPHFNNTREFILERLEKYMERQNSLSAYDNERFYKNGFCDGVRMMTEIIKKENN